MIMNKKPDFIIIGTQKCGTTSLWHHLNSHPEVESTNKEKHFFDFQYDKGLSFYESLFVETNKFQGDGTADYMMHPFVPERINKHFPNIKLIALLRDPVDRAFSHYLFIKHTLIKKSPDFFKEEYTQIPSTFEKALALEDELESIKRKDNLDKMVHSYKKRGRYAEQLKDWFKYFSRDQFLIINSNDLSVSSNEIESFIGLSIRNLSISKERVQHYKPPFKDETREYLKTYFTEHNKNLFKLLGRDFNW